MESKALRALTAAALALPGLANAQDDAAVLQFGRYQETSRDLFGLSSKYEPLPGVPKMRLAPLTAC